MKIYHVALLSIVLFPAAISYSYAVGLMGEEENTEQDHNKDNFFKDNSISSGEISVVFTREDDVVVHKPFRESTKLLYQILRVVSIPPLLITFLVYISIPTLRSLHGKCIICYVLCLLLTYCFLVLGEAGGGRLSPPACNFVTFGCLFFFLAMFFWVNVISYDIWSSFKDLLPITKRKNEEKRPFIYYSIYAWGIPTVILVISLVMDYSPNAPRSFFQQLFIAERCWFRDYHYYFRCWFRYQLTSLCVYIPAGLLMLTNLIFLIVTVCNIRKANKLKNFINSTGARINKRRNGRNKFKSYAKLTIIMGINWAFEVTSWAAGGIDWWWNIPDIVNSLQGVVVFLIFVCNRKTRGLIKKRMCPKARNGADKNSSSVKLKAVYHSTLLSNSSGGTNVTIATTPNIDYLNNQEAFLA